MLCILILVLRLDVNVLNNMKYYIYKLTFASGATYIGQHTEKHDQDGYISSSSYLKNHPEDILTHREILLYVKDKETLDIMETLCIRADKCQNPKNVNKNFGNWHYAYCFTGQKHSEETKRKLSESHYKAGSSVARNIGDKNRGRKNTEETKQLMSKSAKASWTEERKKKASESGNYSHPHNEETKKLLSEMKKGQIWINNGVEEKLVKDTSKYLSNGWRIGKLPITNEIRQKMSESAKKRKCNTVGKKKIHKGDIGKFVSIEDLQKYLNDGWELGVSEKRKEFLRNINKK